MNKKISAKIGEYTNQNGEVKGRYANIGVILSNDNGEFMLLDPTVNTAGVLQLQNQMDIKQGKEPSDRIMCGIFTDQPKGQQQQPQQPQQYQQNNMGPSTSQVVNPQQQQFQQPQFQQAPQQQPAPSYNDNGVNF